MVTQISVCLFSGGQSKALMFAHVSPESGSVSESVSTLNFAQRVKQVELGKANQNKGSLAEMKELVRGPNVGTDLVRDETYVQTIRTSHNRDAGSSVRQTVASGCRSNPQMQGRMILRIRSK